MKWNENTRHRRRKQIVENHDKEKINKQITKNQNVVCIKKVLFVALVIRGLYEEEKKMKSPSRSMANDELGAIKGAGRGGGAARLIRFQPK